jgi:hypothetical protein
MEVPTVSRFGADEARKFERVVGGREYEEVLFRAILLAYHCA